MNLGNAIVGTILGIHLLEEFFRGLQRIGTIPPTFSGTSNGTNFTIEIEPLKFEMAKPEVGPPYTRLHLTGNVTLEAPFLELPLDTWVRMKPELEPAPNQPIDAPVLVFRYDGVDVSPTPPLTDAMIDDVFSSGPVSLIFDSISIPVLDPIIDGARASLFPEDTDPLHEPGLWAAALTLMPAAANQSATVDALGLFVDLPGGDGTPGDITSFLPNLTEFGIVYARDFLDRKFEKLNLEGQTINGAKVTEFTLAMEDTEIHIEGKAKKDVAVIEFSGPITIQLIRGETRFLVDTSAIDVDVILPWWLDLLFFLAGPGGFLSGGLIPVFGGLIFEGVKGKSVSDTLAEIDAAPSNLRGSIAGTFANGIVSLAQALSNLGSLGTLQPALTPESSLVEDGNIAVFAQVFVNPVTETITDGTYSRRANRLLELQIVSGRWFTTSELARIVDLGLVTTPGYRAVGPHIRDGSPVRGYMQDEPDASKDDNLLVRFGN